MDNINRRSMLTTLAIAGVGTPIIGTGSAKQGQRNGKNRVTEVIKDNNAWFLLQAEECIGKENGKNELQREYLEGSLKARLTLQHDGDLQGAEAVHVRGSIGGEAEPRYGNGVWRVKVHFNTQYGYVQSISSPREIYVVDAEVVARSIRGKGKRPTLRAPVQIEIVDDEVGVSAREPARC